MKAAFALPKHIAVVEIGTNTTKFLVTRLETNGGFEPVFFSVETTRIGKALLSGETIDQSGLKSTCDVINRFLGTMADFPDNRTFMIATYALRKASNAEGVIDYIEKTIGMTPKILTGREEARFAYLSAKRALSLDKPYTALIDIGGGSTEIVLAHSGRVLHAQSLALGALHLTERFVQGDPIEHFETLTTHVHTVIQNALRLTEIASLHPTDFDLVGSGGTISTALTMIARRDGSSANAIKPGRPLRLGDIDRILGRCLAASLDERKRIPGLDPSRADIIPAGLAIVLACMRQTAKRVLYPNPGGVREGAVVHLLANGLEW